MFLVKACFVTTKEYFLVNTTVLFSFVGKSQVSVSSLSTIEDDEEAEAAFESLDAKPIVFTAKSVDQTVKTYDSSGNHKYQNQQLYKVSKGCIK